MGAAELRRPTDAARRELARHEHAADLLRAAAAEVARQTDPLAVARVTVAYVARLTQAERVLAGLIADDEFRPQASAIGGRVCDPVRPDEEETRLVRTVRRSQRPAVSSESLAVPSMDHHGRVVAVFVARREAGRRPFTPHEVRLVETLGHVAAVGFDRGRLFERLIDWNRSMEMLLAFNAAINQHLAPRALVRRLVEHSARLLDAAAGFAGLAVSDPSGDSRMEADGYWASNIWHDRPGRWNRGEGTPGFVLETEFPYLSNDYASDPLADSALVGVARAVCVPIKNERLEVLGFFELHRGADGRHFSWHDAAVLETLANTAAVAVENARLWRSLEDTNLQLQAMAAATDRRLEEERRHIARELHDETGQVLIGIKLGLHALGGRVSDDQPDVRAELDDLRQQVSEAAVRIRTLAHQLRPPVLDHCGLDAALRQLADDFRRNTGLVVDVSADTGRRFGSPIETAVYRIAQEALTNTAKHAAAGTARLSLTDLGPTVRFTAADDGRGFAPVAPNAGLGLLGMRERVAALGGEFRLSSGPDGTVIDVTIPVTDADQA